MVGFLDNICLFYKKNLGKKIPQKTFTEPEPWQQTNKELLHLSKSEVHNPHRVFWIKI